MGFGRVGGLNRTTTNKGPSVIAFSLFSESREGSKLLFYRDFEPEKWFPLFLKAL